MMMLRTEPYATQIERWPKEGRHILAQFDDTSVVVYQAYRPEIGRFAASNGFFGGAFRLNRMSWIKPNFLWMMYRCGWGEKQGQEVVLAIRLQRAAFDIVMAQAVHSTYQPGLYSDGPISRLEDYAAWQIASNRSDVRLQWDPDHDPYGAPIDRRAIQLGLRDEALAKYAREWVIDIQDISDFVREQHQYVIANDLAKLHTPREDLYPVTDKNRRERLQLS